MAKKNYISGFGDKDPGAADFLKPTNTNPWQTEASGHQYNGERWNDDRGYERGAQSMGGDEDSFLRPSQTETDHGDRDSVQSIYRDVMDHAGPGGPMLTGSALVRQVGGGSGPPRFKPKSSKQARDDQSNDGL
jgi:hypothetical protein